MRLLLINPRFPESWWSSQWAIDLLPGKRALNAPLGLATLAALCPVDWQVEIVDENVDEIPLAPTPRSLASAAWACSVHGRAHC